MLKYQGLIDQLEMDNDCPYQGCEEREMLGFRWAILPADSEDNFLPKLLLDKKRGKPTRKNSIRERELCSYCALSMFDSEKNALKKFRGFPKRTRELLGYTHILKGIIAKNDGLVSKKSNSGHFDIFEYADTDLVSKFEIVKLLSE